MYAMTLDTLQTVELLQDAGMPAAHAKAVSNIMRDSIASSDRETKNEFKAHTSEMKGAFQKLDISLRHEISHVRKDILAMEERFNSKIVAMDERFDARLMAFDSRLVAMDERFNSQLVTMGKQFDSKLLVMDERFNSKHSAMELRMVRWFVGLALGQFALLTGILIKLM